MTLTFVMGACGDSLNARFGVVAVTEAVVTKESGEQVQLGLSTAFL